MKRFHVHLSVDNLVENIGFYSTLFGSEPNVTKPDYAKWQLDDPRINFAISQRGASAGLNHLGIQVETPEELDEMQQRLQALNSNVIEEDDKACCYAKSDKYWVNDAQGIAWETFHTLETIPVFGDDSFIEVTETACCIPLAKADEVSPCCVPTEFKVDLKTKSCC